MTATGLQLFTALLLLDAKVSFCEADRHWVLGQIDWSALAHQKDLNSICLWWLQFPGWTKSPYSSLPFPPFLCIPSSLKSCHLIALLSWAEVHALSHYFCFFAFLFFFFTFPPYAHTDNSKKMKSCFSKVNWFLFRCIACIIAKQRGLLHCVLFLKFAPQKFRRKWIELDEQFFWGDKRRRLKQKQNTVHDNVLLVIDWKAGFVTVIIPASCILLVIEEKVIKVELI